MMNPPEHLSPGAKQAWAEIIGDIPTGLDAVEAAGIEAFANAIARRRAAQRQLDEEGLIVADDKHRPIEHPALAIERAAAVEVKRWIERYRIISTANRQGSRRG